MSCTNLKFEWKIYDYTTFSVGQIQVLRLDKFLPTLLRWFFHHDFLQKTLWWIELSRFSCQGHLELWRACCSGNKDTKRTVPIEGMHESRKFYQPSILKGNRQSTNSWPLPLDSLLWHLSFSRSGLIVASLYMSDVLILGEEEWQRAGFWIWKTTPLSIW